MPREIAKKESIKTKGKRNFDIGLGDGMIDPWCVKSISECNSEKIKNYLVPNLNNISKYDFSIDWDMKVGSGAGRKALKSIGKRNEKIDVNEFNKIVYKIKQDAIEKYGINVDNSVN